MATTKNCKQKPQRKIEFNSFLYLAQKKKIVSNSKVIVLVVWGTKCCRLQIVYNKIQVECAAVGVAWLF